MPTYEYECTVCAHRFERFQPITAPPVQRCPKCRKKVKRLISAGGGILFKGSGFYQTDYRSASYKKRVESEKCAPCGVPVKDAPCCASEKKSAKH